MAASQWKQLVGRERTARIRHGPGAPTPHDTSRLEGSCHMSSGHVCVSQRSVLRGSDNAQAAAYRKPPATTIVTFASAQTRISYPFSDICSLSPRGAGLLAVT